MPLVPSLPMAIDICDVCGTILVFGVNGKIEPKIVPSKIQSKELNIIGSFIAYNTMPKAVDILGENGILDLDPLITHIIPLAELHHGMDLMRSGEGMEIIIDL